MEEQLSKYRSTSVIKEDASPERCIINTCLLCPSMYCAKEGSLFQTIIEEAYNRHGAIKHHNKSMYPNLGTIDENQLEPQGKEWEV